MTLTAPAESHVAPTDSSGTPTTRSAWLLLSQIGRGKRRAEIVDSLRGAFDPRAVLTPQLTTGGVRPESEP